MSQSHGGGGAHSDDHRNLRNAISTLTHHLTGLGKDGASEHEAAIITLAGSNKGAVMKADLLEEAMEAADAGEEAKLNAYANSNYQAVNNSIMIDGQCEAEDPGVQIEIVDCMEGDDGEKDDDSDVESKKKKKKEEKKEKKKKKEKKEKKKGSSNEEDEGKGSDSE